LRLRAESLTALPRYWFFKGCATTSTQNNLENILRLVMRPEFLVNYPAQDSMSCTYKAGARPRFSDASLAQPCQESFLPVYGGQCSCIVRTFQQALNSRSRAMHLYGHPHIEPPHLAIFTPHGCAKPSWHACPRDNLLRLKNAPKRHKQGEKLEKRENQGSSQYLYDEFPRGLSSDPTFNLLLDTFSSIPGTSRTSSSLSPYVPRYSSSTHL